jgi:hypothetical protein
MAKSNYRQRNMQFGADKELIAMFLKMSPEERLQTNDNAVRTIAELRNAFKSNRRSRHSAEKSQ